MSRVRAKVAPNDATLHGGPFVRRVHNSGLDPSSSIQCAGYTNLNTPNQLIVFTFSSYAPVNAP